MPHNRSGVGKEDNGERTSMGFLVPDILIPSQYFSLVERRSYLAPEKKLMLAVLESAVADLQRHRHAKKGREKRLFREAWEWFTCREDTGVFSFVVICQVVGLDPDDVCERLSVGFVHDKRETQDRRSDPALYGKPPPVSLSGAFQGYTGEQNA